MRGNPKTPKSGTILSHPGNTASADTTTRTLFGVWGFPRYALRLDRTLIFGRRNFGHRKRGRRSGISLSGNTDLAPTVPKMVPPAVARAMLPKRVSVASATCIAVSAPPLPPGGGAGGRGLCGMTRARVATRALVRIRIYMVTAKGGRR